MEELATFQGGRAEHQTLVVDLTALPGRPRQTADPHEIPHVDGPGAIRVTASVGVAWDAEGRPLSDYLPLQADGSTRCGCTIGKRTPTRSQRSSPTPVRRR